MDGMAYGRWQDGRVVGDGGLVVRMRVGGGWWAERGCRSCSRNAADISGKRVRMSLIIVNRQCCTLIGSFTTPDSQTVLSSPTMSALQRSIGSRILPAVARASGTRSLATTSRYHTQDPSPKAGSGDAPGPMEGESNMIRTESPRESMAKHQPDYNVAVDYRTS